MKNMFRLFVGFLAVAPFVVLTYLSAPFIGREKAVKLWGPFLTSLAKLVLNLLIPNIKNASEFDLFVSEMHSKSRLWRPLYDLSIVSDADTVKLYISNCPFCEVLLSIGFSDMAPYVCQGDWAHAKDNIDKWDFERAHQIGTGDSFCDHTYKRKE